MLELLIAWRLFGGVVIWWVVSACVSAFFAWSYNDRQRPLQNVLLTMAAVMCWPLFWLYVIAAARRP